MSAEEVVYSGNCLEALGIPLRGIAVVDRDIKPEVFDLVWCDGCFGGELGGFLKQVIQNGSTPVVRTRYKDDSLNYSFYPKKIFATVLKLMDIDRNVVWERPKSLKYLPAYFNVGDLVYALFPAPGKERFVIYHAEVRQVSVSKLSRGTSTSYAVEPVEFRGRALNFYNEDVGYRLFDNKEDAEAGLKKEREIYELYKRN